MDWIRTSKPPSTRHVKPNPCCCHICSCVTPDFPRVSPALTKSGVTSWGLDWSTMMFTVRATSILGHY